MQPVTVILRLDAQDRAATLALLSRALPVTRRAEGCRHSDTFVDGDDPHGIMLVQGWDSREHQSRYIAWRESTGDLAQLLATLRTPPRIEFLHRDAA